MMRYNVADLLRSSTGAIREAEVEGHVSLEDPSILELTPVTGSARFTRDDAGVLVVADLAITVEMPCARCLEPVAVTLTLELCEQFRPTVPLPGGPEVAGDDPEEDEDTATLINEQHVLDLTEVVRQAALIALPLHPLCRPDCAGLCPICGQDLNVGSCDCEPEPDPRWAQLRAMIDE